MKQPPPKRQGIKRVTAIQLPKKPHQWEAIESVKPEIYHRCVVCMKQKPGEYQNYNECPGYIDLFLHFKEDQTLIIKEYK